MMWEYKSVNAAKEATVGAMRKDGSDLQLNKLGREGWELAGTLSGTYSHGGMGIAVLIFKRELVLK